MTPFVVETLLGTANGWPPTKEREKASGRKGVGTGFHVELEMDSRWDAVPIGCVQGLTWERVYVVPVFRWDVGTGLRCPRFTLSSFYVGIGLRWDGDSLASLASFYVGTFEAGDAVTLRGC